jgi:hypothetical protein
MNVNVCPTTLLLKAYIEELYLGGGYMLPLLYDRNLSTDLTACDSISIELRSPANLNEVAYTAKAILHNDGHASFLFPAGVFGNNYYVIVHHRNSLETWSKSTVLFNSSSVSFDFTSP